MRPWTATLLLLLVLTTARSVSFKEAGLREESLDGEQDDDNALANLEKVLLNTDSDTKTDAYAADDDDSDIDNTELKSDEEDEVVAEDKTRSKIESASEVDSDKAASTNDDDEDGNHGEDDGKEAQESNKEATAQINRGFIRHGHAIALQTYVRNHWLSCAGSKCGRNPCPKMIMSGSDWHRCWGEVFRIYRSNGPGLVRNGDHVGIYYPREPGRWLGCPHSKCGKYSCPGHPNYRVGFSNRSKWNRCGGEIFIIYARDKPYRAPIRSNDDVALYLARIGQWLSQCGGNAVKRLCLGKARPPPRNKYDGCACETFTIVSAGRKC